MKTYLPLALLVAWGLPVVAAAQQNDASDDQQRNATPPTQRNDEAEPERREAGFRGTARTTQNQGQQDELVAYLAAKLQLANQAEIQLATLAAQRAEHPEVKQFAEMLVQSHRQLNEQIAQAVPGLPNVGSRQRGDLESRSTPSPRAEQRQAEQRQAEQQRAEQRQGEQLGSEQSGDRPALSSRRESALSGAHQELIAISRRAVDNQVRMTSEMFRDKEGARFDMCFVSQQIGAHMWYLSELQAIGDAGPAEFSQVVRQSEQKMQQHLEQAKQLAEKIEKQLTSGQDRQSSRREQNTQRDRIE